MIEKEVYSIEITPICILDKAHEKTLVMIANEENKLKYDSIDSAPLVNFNEGDYLFMGKMIGRGFQQINYIQMNEQEVKEYFPKARKEPEDRFSRFAGTALFPDKK